MGELSAEGYFKQKEETLIDLIPVTRQATGLGNAFRILLFKQGVGQFSVVTTGQFSVAITTLVKFIVFHTMIVEQEHTFLQEVMKI
jgi:hypothetical protein